MSVDSLIKMFEQYGWPGVLAVVCILIVYYFISKKDKKSLDTINAGFTGLATTMAKQNENLIDAITESNEKTQERLFTLINKSIDSKEQARSENHKKSISKRQEISEYIDKVLFDILLWSNAQRVSIIEFHNSKEIFSMKNSRKELIHFHLKQRTSKQQIFVQSLNELTTRRLISYTWVQKILRIFIMSQRYSISI